MQTPDSIADETLDRFLAGEATESEREVISRWFADNPEHAGNIDALMTVLRGKQIETDVDAAWNRLERRIESQRVSSGRWIPAPYRALIAAGITIVAATGIWAGTRDRSPEPSRIAIRTAAGETRTISLADGSTITLAPRSGVQYTETKSKVSAVVTGMAGFNVVHDKNRQFSVAVGNARVVDQGTEFVVQSYPSDSIAMVFVKSGQVGVGSAGSTSHATLGARQGAVIHANGSVETSNDLASQIADYEAELGGRFVFERRSIESIAHTLSNWYGVNVVVEPALKARRITAMFQKPTLKGVLDVIAETTGSSYRISGDSVVITRRTQ